MTQYLGLIQQGLFFGFFLTLLFAALSYFLYPLLQHKIRSLNPARQSDILLFWNMLPVLASFFILFVALLPSLLEMLGISTDHCLGHPEGHLHFCLIHLHAPSNSLFIWGPALFYLGFLLTVVLNLCVDLCETCRFKRKLNNFNPEKIAADTFLLDTDTPLALSCGLWRQQIFLSTGLVNNLSGDEYDIVIQHERAHIKRRDALKKLLARGFSLAHFPALRRQQLCLFILSNEQACDNASVRQPRDKSTAAELLVKIEKLYRGHFFSQSALTSGVMSPETNILAERIHNLLNNKNPQSSSFPLILAMIMIAAALFFGHDLIHDSLEHLMFLLSIFI